MLCHGRPHINIFKLTGDTGHTEYVRGCDVEGLEDICWIIGVYHGHVAAVMCRRTDPDKR